MKGKNNWACFLMILAGIVIGGFIGSLFPNTFLNFGQTFWYGDSAYSESGDSGDNLRVIH